MKKGFTITELIAVIVIIAILSVAAISGFNAMSRNSKAKALQQKIAQIEIAAEKYAKDTNVNNYVSISVNRLVVMGYLQPDSTTTDGLAVINNPVTNESLICNIVDIKIVNDDYKAVFNDKVKDCNIIDKEANDENIIISAYNVVNDISESLQYESGTTLRWTNKDVLLFVNSNYFNDAYSIIYEYGGNRIEKLVNSMKANTVSAPSEAGNYYNEIVISDVGVIYNNTVDISILMKDGSTRIKSIILRIDKEAPIGYVVNSNDMSTNKNSERTVQLFMDDGGGSGVEGFYVNDSDSIDETKFVPKTGSLINGTFDADLKQGTFVAKRGKYYIYIKDKVGNLNANPIIIDVTNFDPNEINCDVTIHNYGDKDGATLNKYREGWFNKPITVKFKSRVAAGDGGIKWSFLRGSKVTGESDLKSIADVGQYAETTYNENAEINITTFGGGLKGMTSKNNTVKTCDESFGIDLTPPTINFAYSENTTAKQTHKIGIEINDNRSGFYADSGTKRKLIYNWSTSSTSPGTNWQEINLTMSNEGKTLKGEITSNLNKTGGSKLTGEYYLFIKEGTIQDKAQNNLQTLTPGVVFKFDNTAPTCNITSSNSPSQNGVDISISCTEKGSVKSGCSSSNKTSDSNLKSTQNYEIKDNAGNKTSCTAKITSYVERRRASAKTCPVPYSCLTDWIANSPKTSCSYTNNSYTKKKKKKVCTYQGYGGDSTSCTYYCDSYHKNTTTCYKDKQSGSSCGWYDYGDWSTKNKACNSDKCKSQERTMYKLG